MCAGPHSCVPPRRAGPQLSRAWTTDSIWKKIANSKAWQIIVMVVTVVLVIAVVVALVVGTGGGVLALIIAAAGLILTLDDVAQFMAGNMSGSEFALAIAMNFIPGGKVAKALATGVKRAVRPLAKVAGSLGVLSKVTGPAMAKLADGLRKAGENLTRRISGTAGDGARRKSGTASSPDWVARRDADIKGRLDLPPDEIEKLRSRFIDAPGAPEVKNGRIDVPGSGGKTISVEDYVRVRHASTWNDDAPETVLGKFKEGKKSYTAVAEAEGARHFNLGADGWARAKNELSLTDDEMFEMFNRPFLAETIARADSVRFTVDPRKYEHGSALWKEYDLLETAGYKMQGGWLRPRRMLSKW